MKDSTAVSCCQSSSAEVAEAFFEIAQMIAEANKSHNIGETLIKSCMLKAVVVLWEKQKPVPELLTLSFSSIPHDVIIKK